MPPNSANEAVLQLGNLASMSRLVVNGTPQPLLPTRVHTIYSGLPKHYICTNSSCSVRRVEDGNAHLGRLYFLRNSGVLAGPKHWNLSLAGSAGRPTSKHMLVNNNLIRSWPEPQPRCTSERVSRR